MALSPASVAREGVGFGASHLWAVGFQDVLVGTPQSIVPSGLDASAAFGTVQLPVEGNIDVTGIDARAVFGLPIVWIPSPGGIVLRTREGVTDVVTAEGIFTTRSQEPVTASQTSNAPTVVSTQEPLSASTTGPLSEARTGEPDDEVSTDKPRFRRNRSGYIPPDT